MSMVPGIQEEGKGIFCDGWNFLFRDSNSKLLMLTFILQPLGKQPYYWSLDPQFFNLILLTARRDRIG